MSYISRGRTRNIILAFTFVGAVMALTLALLVSGSARVQGSGLELTPEPSPCTKGTVVSKPSEEPFLVGDCEALWAFKNSLDLGSRTRINWGADVPIAQWEGVKINTSTSVSSTTITYHQRVSDLNLSSRDLLGSLPPELGSLTYLQTLYLNDNSFIGQIPKELGQLDRLAFLDLSVNGLSGQIPKELGKLSGQLWHLNLRTNNLSGQIPKELVPSPDIYDG